MAFLEHRPIGDFGLPRQGMLGRNFWLGALLGLVEVSVLVGLISAFGGYSFGNLALSPGDAIRWASFYCGLLRCVTNTHMIPFALGRAYTKSLQKRLDLARRIYAAARLLGTVIRCNDTLDVIV
jgi:hypothetical protein